MTRAVADASFEEELTAKLLTTRKYRSLNLPSATLRDLIMQAREVTSDPKAIEQVVREKLHNLVAVYLGDPDYAACEIKLAEAFAIGDTAVKNVCLEILRCHASTRERLPLLDEFYQRIFAFTGMTESIMDLACGLNPFAIPWMGLKPGTRYHAYDLHQPRVDLINTFLTLNKMEPLAVHQDILVEPPEIECDVAFFFKEAHRFEQRRRGCNRAFFQALKCKTLLVSLPTASLTGKHPKLDQHRRLIMETVSGLPWKVSEIEFSNEIVFCIEK
jgi:16S rRNA (guanine(1405)-N(7))-methyltransferase